MISYAAVNMAHPPAPRRIDNVIPHASCAVG